MAADFKPHAPIPLSNMGRRPTLKRVHATTSANATPKMEEVKNIFSIGDTDTTRSNRQQTLRPFQHFNVNIMATENRPRLTLNLDGVEVDFLYDTGAISTALTYDTYLRHFKHKPLLKVGADLCAAGNVSLNYMGSIPFEVKFRNQTVTHMFDVCEKINDNCFGINLIHDFKVSYNGITNTLYAVTSENREPQENQLLLKELTTFPANSVMVVYLKTKAPPGNKFATMMINVHSNQSSALTAGPALARVDPLGRCLVAIMNAAPYPITCQRNDFMGTIEPLERETDPIPLNSPTVASIFRKNGHTSTAPPAASTIRQHLQQTGTPAELLDEVMELLLRHQHLLVPQAPQAQAQTQFKEAEPHFQRQPRIPEAHRDLVEDQIEGWINQGLVRQADSMFNTPLTCVKTTQGWKVMQDFRELNRYLTKEPEQFKGVQELLGPVATNQSAVFSTIDLSSSAWQLKLSPEQQALTAFSCPGSGQFVWKQAPLHLAGASTTFHRIISAMFENQAGIIPHIDKIIVHTPDADQHFRLLRHVLQKLDSRKLTLNLAKSSFCTDAATVMGFRLKQGQYSCLPGPMNQLAKAPAPTTTAMVKSFLGLSNFFRAQIRNYAEIAAPLNDLIKTSSTYRGGPLPLEAARAFEKLRSTLCSAPILSVPRPDRQFAVIVDASTGTESVRGGIGAILTQMDKDNRFHTICYASRLLNDKEKQMSPFLLEMAAAVWAIQLFADHLRGRRFVVFTDHKPLQKVALARSKILNSFQQLALEFDFITQHKKGINMPADYLSRAIPDGADSAPAGTQVVNTLTLEPSDMVRAQSNTADLDQLRKFRVLGKYPPHISASLQKRLSNVDKQVFVDNEGRYWVRLNTHNNPRAVLWAPDAYRQRIIREAHASPSSGHDGVERALERITTSYWWPFLEDNLTDFIKTCPVCQKKNKTGHQKLPLKSLPVPDGPNNRVHVDLMGPLKSHTDNKYILGITDAFTKVGILVPLPNKEANTVAVALLHHWIYRFSIPKQIHSDQGKEFCNQVLQVSNTCFSCSKSSIPLLPPIIRRPTLRSKG